MYSYLRWIKQFKYFLGKMNAYLQRASLKNQTCPQSLSTFIFLFPYFFNVQSNPTIPTLQCPTQWAFCPNQKNTIAVLKTFLSPASLAAMSLSFSPEKPTVHAATVLYQLFSPEKPTVHVPDCPLSILGNLFSYSPICGYSPQLFITSL